jgi:hypothetical protein
MVGLAMMTIGGFIEELGGFLLVRVGHAMRVLAALIAFGSIALVFVSGIRSTIFGWVFVIPSLVCVGLAASFDARRFRDTRYGESIRMDSIDDAAITLAKDDRTILIPLRAVGAAFACDHTLGRGIALLVKERASIQGNADALPWGAATRDGELFALTEQQCNADARKLAARIQERLDFPREKYR